jgi:YesN/AraC family two-component response regulator
MKSKTNILIIDDDRVSQIYLSELIGMTIENASIAKADSGEKALELLKKQSFHFIFSDILMPGLSEEKLFCELKDSARFSPTTKIIAISGIDDISQIKKMAPGATLVLKKPIERDVLRDVLLGEGLPIKTTNENHTDTVVLDLNLIVKLYQNKPEKLVSLLNLYKNSLPKQYKGLKSAFETQNGELLRNNAHSLKNSFAYLGATDLRSKALYIEDNAQLKGNPEKLKNHIDKVLASESVVLAKIEELINNYE